MWSLACRTPFLNHVSQSYTLRTSATCILHQKKKKHAFSRLVNKNMMLYRLKNRYLTCLHLQGLTVREVAKEGVW